MSSLIRKFHCQCPISMVFITFSGGDNYIACSNFGFFHLDTSRVRLAGKVGGDQSPCSPNMIITTSFYPNTYDSILIQPCKRNVSTLDTGRCPPHLLIWSQPLITSQQKYYNLRNLLLSYDDVDNPRPETANAQFSGWKTWVSSNFTWLYIGSQVSQKNPFTA